MTKQIRALKLAIKALEKQRRLYSVGHYAYRQGHKIDSAEIDHKNFEKISQAIEQLEDLIEILQDPGVTHVKDAEHTDLHPTIHAKARGEDQEHRRRNSRTRTQKAMEKHQSRQLLLAGLSDHPEPEKGT